MNAPKTILVLGGSGFVGRAVCAELTRRTAFAGVCLRVPTRRPERVRELSVLPGCAVIEANVHDPAALTRLLHGVDAVISLVGVLHSPEPAPGESWGPAFARAHVALPASLARCAEQQGVRRVVHISALGAAADAPSGYLRSKAAGEAALRAADLDLTVLRPSVIFGRDDAFLNLFARLAGVLPVLPLAGAGVRFAPVWVGDVAAVIADCLERPGAIGKSWALCGPRVYRLRELAALAARYAGHRSKVVALPAALAWAQARLMELLPNPPLTRDNLRSLRLASVCPPGSTLPFGRPAAALEGIVPGYRVGA